MQTSQAISPANMLSAPASAGKPADAPAATEPFGNVLSREVAERGADRNPSRESASSETAVKRLASTHSPEPTDPASPVQQDAAESSPAMDAAEQFSSALLALVASINEITGTRSDESSRAASDETLVQVDPALVAGIAARLDRLSLQSAGPAAGSGLTAAAEAGKSDASVLAGAQHFAPAALSLELAEGELSEGAETQKEAIAFAATLRDSLSAASAGTQQMQVAQTGPGLQTVQAIVGADKLTPPVGSPGWDQALGQKVVWMVAGGQQSATLTLNPPDLGPLQVVLDISNAQASASFTAAQPEVRQALEAALPRLREMLDNAGIQLGHASVGSGSAGQQGSDGQQNLQAGASRMQDSGESGALANTPGQTAGVSAGLGLVNTYA